ncbi:MAG TPA: hypothetical protein VKV04_09990 [Verrucomicrobiae bacterium]|nr:hypothetical protein [Verrucomicrobiae bacterium]
MKKLMCLLAVAALMVGCASDHNAGGTSDQTEMSSGTSDQNQVNSGNYSWPADPDPVTNRVLQAP